MEEDTREEQPLESDVKPSLVPQEQGSQKKKKKLADKKEPQTAVRKSSRPRKQSKRVLDSADCNDEKIFGEPPRKRHRKFVLGSEKDTLPNDKPFSCSLCESPQINNHPGKARIKHVRQPIIKEKDGQLLQLCVKCAMVVGQTESKVATLEQKAEFEEEGKRFAQQLAQRFNDEDASSLYCSSYYTTKCGCIQSYIHGSLTSKKKRSSISGSEGSSSVKNEPAEEEAKPSIQPTDETERANFLLSLLKEAKAWKATLKQANVKRKRKVSEEKVSASKEYEKFVMTNRNKLRNLGMCERGCQRLLCYSNNFLHKKAVGRQPRVQRVKGRAALGQLQALEELPKLRCCDKSCVKVAESNLEKVSQWRKHAQKSQKEMWRVITEMLSPDDPSAACCHKFITMVTGCCTTTAQKVHGSVLLSKRTSVKWAHGMRDHWEKQKGQSKKEESKNKQNKKEQNKLTKASSSKGSGTKSESTIFILNSAASPVATMTTSSHASTTASPLSVIPASPLTSVPASPLTFVSNSQVISLTVPSLLPLAGQGNTATVNNLGSPLVSQVIPQLLSANPQHLIAAPQYLPVTPQQHQEQQQHHQQQPRLPSLPISHPSIIQLGLPIESASNTHHNLAPGVKNVILQPVQMTCPVQVVTTFVTEAVTGTAVTTVTSAVPSMVVSSRASVSEAVTEPKHQVASQLGAVMPQETSGQTSQGHSTVEVRQERDREVEEGSRDIREKVLQLCEQITDPQDLVAVQKMLADFQKNLAKSRTDAEEQGSSSQQVPQPQPVAASPSAAMSVSMTAPSKSSVGLPTSSTVLQENSTVNVHSLKAGRPFVHIRVPQKTSAESISASGHHVPHTHMECAATTNSLPVGSSALADAHPVARKARETIASFGVNSQVTQATSLPFQLTNQASKTVVLTGNNSSQLIGFPQVTLPFVMINSSASSLTVSPQTSSSSVTSIVGAQVPLQVGVPLTRRITDNSETSTLAPTAQVLSVLPSASPAQTQPASTGSVLQPVPPQLLPTLVTDQPDLTLSTAQPTARMSYIVAEQPRNTSQGINSVSYAQSLASLPSVSGNYPNLSSTSALAMQQPSLNSSVCIQRSQDNVQVFTNSPLSLVPSALPEDTSLTALPELLRSHSSSGHAASETPRARQNLSFVNTVDEKTASTSSESPSFQTNPAATMQNGNSGTDVGPQNNSASQHNMNGNIVSEMYSSQGLELSHQGTGIDHLLSSSVLVHPLGNFPVGTPSSCSSGSFVFDALADSPVKDGSLNLSPSSQPIPVVPTSSLLCEMLMRPNVMSLPVATSTTLSAACSSSSSSPSSSSSLSSTASSSLSSISLSSLPSSSSTAIVISVPDFNFSPVVLTTPHVSPLSTNVSCSSSSGISTPHTLCQSLNSSTITTPSTMSSHIVTAIETGQEPRSSHTPVAFTIGHNASLSQSQLKLNRVNRHKDPPQVGIVHPHVSAVKGSSTTRTSAGPSNSSCSSGSSNSSSSIIRISNAMSLAPACVTVSSRAIEPLPSASGRATIEQPNLSMTASPNVAPFVENQNDQLLQQQQLQQSQLLLNMYLNSGQTTNLNSQVVANQLPAQGSQINLSALFGTPDVSPSHVISPSAANAFPNIIMQSGNQSTITDNAVASQNQNSGSQAGITYLSPNQTVIAGDGSRVANSNINPVQQMANSSQLFQTVVCPNTGQIKLVPVIMSSEASGVVTTPSQLSQNGQLILSMSPLQGLNTLPNLSPQILSRDGNSFQLNLSPNLSQFFSNTEQPLGRETQSGTVVNSVSSSAQANTQNLEFVQILSNQRQTSQGGPVMLNSQPASAHSVIHNELVHAFSQASDRHCSPAASISGTNQQGLSQHAQPNFRNNQASAAVQSSHNSSQSAIPSMQTSQGSARNVLPAASQIAEPMVLNVNGVQQYQTVPQLSVPQEQVLQAGTLAQGLGVEIQPQVVIQSQNWSTGHQQTASLSQVNVQQPQAPVLIQPGLHLNVAPSSMRQTASNQLIGQPQILQEHAAIPIITHGSQPNIVVQTLPSSQSVSSVPADSSFSQASIGNRTLLQNRNQSSPWVNQVSPIIPLPNAVNIVVTGTQTSAVQSTKNADTSTTSSATHSSIARSEYHQTSTVSSTSSSQRHRPIMPKLAPVAAQGTTPSPSQKFSVMLVPNQPGNSVIMLDQEYFQNLVQSNAIVAVPPSSTQNVGGEKPSSVPLPQGLQSNDSTVVVSQDEKPNIASTASSQVNLPHQVLTPVKSEKRQAGDQNKAVVMKCKSSPALQEQITQRQFQPRTPLSQTPVPQEANIGGTDSGANISQNVVSLLSAAEGLVTPDATQAVSVYNSQNSLGNQIHTSNLNIDPSLLGQAQTLLTQAGSILITSTNSLQQGPLSLPQAQVISLQNESSAAINSSESLRQAMSLIGSGSDVSQEGSQILSQDISGSSGGISDQQAYSKQPFASHVGTLSLQTNDPGNVSGLYPSTHDLLSTTTVRTSVAVRQSSSGSVSDSSQAVPNMSTSPVATVASNTSPQQILSQKPEQLQSSHGLDASLTLQAYPQSTSAGLSSQNLPASLERQGIRLQTSQSTNVASKSGLVVSCGENPKTYTVAISGSELASAGLQNVNQRTETASNTNSAGSAPLTVTLGLNTTHAVNKSEVKSSVASTCIPFLGTRPSSSQLMLHLVQPVAGSLPAVATTRVPSTDTQSQDEPIQYLRSNEVIDLTDDSPPPTPSRSLTNLDRSSRVTKQAQQPPQSTLLLEELQKQIPPHTVVATQQNQLQLQEQQHVLNVQHKPQGQLYQENANPQRSAAQAEVGESSNSGHQPSTQMATGSSHSQFLNLDDIPATMRQALIASLEAHAAGNPDVQLVTRTLAPSDGLTHQDFLPSGLESQQMQAQVSELSKAISKNKCLSAVVTISTSQRFQQGLAKARSQAQDPAMTVTATAQDNRTEQAVPVSGHDGSFIQPVPQQMVVCSVNQPSSSVQATLSNNVLPINVSMMSYTPSQTSLPLPTSSAAVAAMLSGQSSSVASSGTLFPTQTASVGTPVMSAAPELRVGCSPSHLSVSLGRSAVHPLTSSSVTFTRTSNMPNDAVGPPNITIMSPTRANPSPIRRVRQDSISGVAAPVFPSPGLPVASPGSVPVDTRSPGLSDVQRASGTPELVRIQKSQTAPVSAAKMAVSDSRGLVFSKAQGRQSLPAVVTTSAGSVELVTNTAGSSTQPGERLMVPKESQKKSKPRTRASTVMDLLRKKEQQESAEASSASSGVPVSSTSGPVTLMFSSDTAGAPKLFVVGAKPGQQDTESQTLQNTVKNLQLIGPLTSSTAAATSQQSGFTILQPRMMQLPNTSVSNVVFQSAPTTTVTLADQIAGCVTQVLTVSSEKLQQKPVYSSITTASQAHQIPLSSTSPAAAANIPLALGSPAVTKVLLTSQDTVSSRQTACSVGTDTNRQSLDGKISMVASGATKKVMNASHQSKQEDKDLPQAQLIGQPPVVSTAHQQGVDSSILNLLGSQKDQGLRVQTQGSAEEALQLKSALNQSQGSQNYTKMHKFTLSQNPPGFTFVENYASQDASSGMGNVKRLLLSSSSPVVSDSNSKSSSSMVTGVAEGGSQALSSLDHMMSMKSPQLLQLMKSNTGPQVNPNTSGHIIPHAKSPDQSTLKLTSAVRQTPDSTWTSQKSQTTQLEEGIALDTKVTPGGSQRPLLLIRPKTSVEQTSMKISSTESDPANRSSTQSMRSRLPSANPLLATILFAGPNARSASSPVTPGVSSSATSSVMVQPAVDTPQRAGVAEDMVRGSASLHPVTTMGNFNVVYNLHPQQPPRNTLQESLEKPSGLIEGESLKDQIDQHMKGDLELASKNPNNPPMATFQQVPPAYVQPPRYDVAARELKQAEYTNLAMRLRSPPQYEAATRSELSDRPHSKNNTSLTSETHPVQSGRIEKVIEDIYKFPDEGDEPSPPPVLGGLKSHNIGQKFRFTPAGAIISHRRLSDIPEQAGDTILGQTSETGLEPGSRKGNKTSHEVLNNEFATVDHLRAPSKPSESASVVFSEAEPSAPLWKSPKKVKGKRDTGKVSGKINSKKVQFSDVVTSKSVRDYGQSVGVNTSSRLTSADGLVVHTTPNKNLAWSEESPYLSSRDYIPPVTDGDQAKICRLDNLALVQRGDVPSESSRAEVRDCRLKALLSSESSAQRGRTASSTGTHQEPGLYYVPREDLGHRDSNSELLYYQQGHDAEDGTVYSYLPRVISRCSETSTGLELASRHTTERMSYETAHEAVGYIGQAHPSGVSFTPEGPAGLRTKQKVVPGHDTGAVATETYSQFDRSEKSKEMMGRRLAPVDEDTPQSTVAGHLLDLGKAPHASDIRSQQATSQDEREYMKESDRSVSFDRPSSFNILSRQGYSKLHRQRLSRLQSDQDAADDSTLSSMESSHFSVHSQGSVTETSNSSDHFEMVRNSPQMPRWLGRTESVPGHLISASGDTERRPSESPLHRQRMLESNFELARQMDHTVKDGRSENQRLESPQKFIGHSVRRLEGSTDNYLPRDGDYNSVLRDSEHRALSTQGSTLNTPVFMEQLEGRGGIDLNDDLLSNYTHLTREIHSFMAINQKLKHEVAKAEQLQQRQRQQSTADKQQSPMMEVDLGEKSLYSSPSASTSQSHYTDNESMVPLRKRHSSSGILKRSPLPDAELLRLDEGGTTRSRHPSLTNAGIRQMLDSDIGPQDGHPRGSSAGHSYPKAGYSGDDHSGSDHFTRGQRDPLVSSSSLSRPSSQMELSSPPSEIVRHRYPSSEMKPLFSRSNLEEAAFIPLDHTRHRNLSSSLGLRASSDLDPPPYDSSHRQRNPSASSLKSTFPPLTDAEFLNFDLGTRSRNPSSSSWMRYMDILQDSNLSAIRSRNPSGSSNRRSRPGSSSSDREFPVNMDELPMFTEYVRTRSRNSSGESIEPTMELLLDPQQILHVYNSACPRQNRH